MGQAHGLLDGRMTSFSHVCEQIFEFCPLTYWHFTDRLPDGWGATSVDIVCDSISMTKLTFISKDVSILQEQWEELSLLLNCEIACTLHHYFCSMYAVWGVVLPFSLAAQCMLFGVWYSLFLWLHSQDCLMGYFINFPYHGYLGNCTPPCSLVLG